MPEKSHDHALILAQRRSSSSPSKARTMALFMHMSILCGVPIFFLGLFFRREDPFLLHHAKAAGAGFLFFYATLLLGLLFWTPLFWVALGFYLPSLVGVWRSVKGERAGWLGLGHIGEALFFPLQPRPTTASLKSLDSSTPPHLLSDE